ncbi:MAG TPA: hypothetical protein ENN85_08880 [Methanoculleus sp.]|nr:hypothetical protein [Methanoculleus sp.]
MDTGDVIPIEMRWRFVTRTLTGLPFLYERALRDAAGEEYGAKMGDIFRELARDMTPVATAFRLPTGNAPDLAMTVDLLCSVLFGPGFKGEPLEATDQGAVFRRVDCPFVAIARERGFNPAHAYFVCTAFKTALVEGLNEEYRSSVPRACCFGDTVCEMVIERKEESPR